MSSPYTNSGLSSPGSDVREAALKAKPQTKPRFVARNRPDHRTVLHWVDDERLQLTVFHWYGPSGAAKAEAVARALNALEPE